MVVTDSSGERIKWKKDDGFKNMIRSIRAKIGGLTGESPQQKILIHKVERATSGDSYTPRLVSIGPIHRTRADLVAMEEMKLRYTSFFFYRFRDPVKALRQCSNAIIDLEQHARGCYAHNLNKLNKYELTQLLLVDGCFILELCLRHAGEREYPYLTEQEHDVHREIDIKNDPILSNDWIHGALCQNLALLENQIPFMVLESLFSRIRRVHKSNLTLPLAKDYVLFFFSSSVSLKNEAVSIMINRDEKAVPHPRNVHLLDVLHKALLPAGSRPEIRKAEGNIKDEKKMYGLKYSATKLLNAGVDIKKADGQVDTEKGDNFDSHLLEIVFDMDNGIIRIPEVRVGGLTSLITKNLVAFEQHSFDISHHVTAYVMFMKSLIIDKKDVQLLKRKGIIKPLPGISDQNVIDFFRTSCHGEALKDFYYSQLCQQVQDYTSSWKHVQRYRTYARNQRRKRVAVLRRDYCPNACRTIAFFAAFALIVFSAAQTFFTIYPYYKTRS